ncbi:MAG: ABC transporter permease [Anaerolineales bacterium]
MEIILELLQPAVFIGLLTATVRMATPLLMASLGQIFSQLAGVLDLSVEGVVLSGAFWGFVGAFFSGSIWVGLAAGVLAGLLVSLLMAFMSVTLRANQTITGIMLVIMMGGFTFFMNKLIFGGTYIPPKTAGFQEIAIPILSAIPVVGQVLFRQNLLVYIAFALVPVLTLVLYRTTYGLNIRAVGEHPRAVDSVGINVFRLQYSAVLLGGMLAGLSGVFLTLAHTNLFTDNISAGRGWLAVALVFFGKWRPWQVMLGAILFGFVNALQLRLQAMAAAPLAFQVMLMLPYLLTIVVLTTVARKASGPAAMCVPYTRE